MPKQSMSKPHAGFIAHGILGKELKKQNTGWGLSEKMLGLIRYEKFCCFREDAFTGAFNSMTYSCDAIGMGALKLLCKSAV